MLFMAAQIDSRAQETAGDWPWYLSIGMGQMDFEGDEDFSDSFILSSRLGYDYNERWTLEGGLTVAPSVDATEQTGEPPLSWSSTHALALSLDGLFHFTRWERLDPYIAAGVGLVNYGEEPTDGAQTGLLLRGGGGVMYHFNDEWAVRADYRGMLAGFGSSASANSILDFGIAWFWGANVPPKMVAVSGPLDSDGDGLTDEEERAIGTDPYDPDTDKDRLTDGQEVKTYHTDPLNPDTDYDALTDGAEVLDHKTDPLKRDTDNGGVADGHEVLEDSTNPLNPADDLLLYELYIQFDFDKDIIKPAYFKDLNTIGKVLKRNPNATARIEGHADKLKGSKVDHNMKLSERRAQAVCNFLSSQAGIAASHLQPVGYGFSRPKAPNDPVNGNPINRRVEVYIRGLSLEERENAKKSDALTDSAKPDAAHPGK